MMLKSILVISTLIILSNLYLFGILWLIVLLLSVLIGFIGCNVCIKRNIDLTHILKLAINSHLRNHVNISEHIFQINGANANTTSSGSVSCHPFKRLMVNKAVNHSVQQILELTLNEYLDVWHKQIGFDNYRLNYELRNIFRYIFANLMIRTKNVNINEIILKKLLKILANHLEMFINGKRRSKSANNIEECVLKQYGCDLHSALHSRKQEMIWLSNIIQQLMPYLLPPKYLNNKAVESFFKELLNCSILLPIIDICGDPDKVNAFLILLFDTSPVYYDRNNGPMVEILESFTYNNNQTSAQNNCFGIELKTILSDQQLLFLFTQFSNEEGFVNLVKFILHMNNFSQQILNPDLTEQQLSELHVEAQNIYNSYFLPNSIDYINFSEDIANGFSDIVSGKFQDVEKLRTTEPLYHSYDYVYNLLETRYCPLFFESDIYLKLVCGQRSASFDTLNVLGAKNEKGLANSHRVNSTESFNSLQDFNNDNIECYDTQQRYEKLNQNDMSDNISEDRLKDLSAWRVSIPHVDSRVDSNGREYEIFIIEVQRLDVQQHDNSIDVGWDVERRYNEFYVLESKLKEFHGENFNTISLPPKRSFVKLSKPFLESRRPDFEKFLKQLLANATLKGSELVFNFLNPGSDEFTTGFLPDIKLGKIIKTVPAKFSKERGQHLESFLLSFIASTEQLRPKPSKNEIPELLENSPFEFGMINIENSLYGDNMAQFNDNKFYNEILRSEYDVKCNKIYAQLEYVYDYLMFLLIRFYNLNNYVLKLLLIFRPLLRKPLQLFCEWFLCYKLKKTVFIEQRLVEVIHVLRDALFFEKDLPLRSSKQKKLRSQLALKCAKEFIPNWIIDLLGKDKHDEVVFLLFSIFQYPLLNKQFIYVSLDIILKEMFSDIF